MNTLRIVVLCLLPVLVAGCDRTPRSPQADRPDVNAALVNAFSDAAIDNAIVAQHTLFPYHFEADGAALNELGQHDLKVLAAHYKDHPGPLNVRRGEAPAALYEARVAEVVKTLVAGGVAKNRVSLGNGLAGGEGMKSEQVLSIREREKKPQNTTYIMPSASGAASGAIGGTDLGGKP